MLIDLIIAIGGYTVIVGVASVFLSALEKGGVTLPNVLGIMAATTTIFAVFCVLVFATVQTVSAVGRLIAFNG